MTNPKHTTAEYLAWIDERIAKLDEVINNPCAWGIETEIEYRASLLANRDVLERQPKKATAPYVLTQRGWGYNQCLEELQTDIYNRIREVME